MIRRLSHPCRPVAAVLALALQTAPTHAQPNPACPLAADAPQSGHTATLLPNGQVLVAGGLSRSSSSGEYGCECDVFGEFSQAWLYDPVSNTWSPAAPLARARADFTATLLPTGHVLAAGGGGAAGGTAELYDPEINTWSPAAPMTIGRRDHSATLLPSGQVLVAGGGAPDGASGRAIPSELYDPASNRWSRVGATRESRTWHTTTLLPSGKVLVTGGYRDEPTTLSFTDNRIAAGAARKRGSADTSGAELYDPAKRAWSFAGAMGLSRHSTTATLLPSGKVLVVGGGTRSGTTASAELYDPKSNAWADVRPMRVGPREGHSAVLLTSGKVLVAGGKMASQFASASAELYDPTTNTWSSANMMKLGRAHHTATLLPSGKVLVVGGIRDNAGSTGAELYDPASNSWSLTGPMTAPRPTAAVASDKGQRCGSSR